MQVLMKFSDSVTKMSKSLETKKEHTEKDRQKINNNVQQYIKYPKNTTEQNSNENN